MPIENIEGSNIAESLQNLFFNLQTSNDMFVEVKKYFILIFFFFF
jgi:hypothetical protein